MSTATDQSGDMFLARRFNFLGFPGERDKRRGATPYTSYADLRAELGDDNAAALVSKVGVLVQKRGLEALGVSLPHVVDRIVQSLSPDERRTMAEGGTVPRVESLVSAEVTQAESQQRLDRAKADDLKTAANGQYAALGVLGARKGDTAGKADSSTGSNKELSSYERQQEAIIASATATAKKYGLEWVIGNKDLLRLGSPAIEIIHQTQLQKETFTRLRDAGFSTKGSVGIASLLHEHGSKNVNKDAQTLADNVKSLNDPTFKAAIDARAKLQVPAPDETPAQAEARKAQIPAAEDQVRAAAAAHIAKKPQNAAKVKSVTETLGVKLEKDEAATKATAEKNAKADAKDAEADALLAGLNDSKPAASAAKGQEQAPNKHDQGKPKGPKPSGKPPVGPSR